MSHDQALAEALAENHEEAGVPQAVEQAGEMPPALQVEAPPLRALEDGPVLQEERAGKMPRVHFEDSVILALMVEKFAKAPLPAWREVAMAVRNNSQAEFTMTLKDLKQI